MSSNFLNTTPFNRCLTFISHSIKSISSALSFPFNKLTRMHPELSQPVLASKAAFGLINLKIVTRKLMILGILVISAAFHSHSQQVSIGLPNDGIEGTSDISYTIFLEGGATNTTGAPITGGLQFLGTATNGVDYIAPTSFSIPNGASTTILTLTVIDDAILELTEGVTTLIGALNVGTVFTAISTANIIDNEVAVLSIGSPVDALEGTSDISFSVFLEGGMTNTIGLPITGTVNLSGTAINGVDYTDVTTFSIPPGSNSTTILVPIIDDANVEATETVIGTISGPNVGSIGTASSTANIMDDEAVAVLISIGSPTDGSEGVSNVSFIVSMDGGAINTTGTSITGTITYTGTASSGIDYTEVITFTIPNGANSEVISIVVLDDLIAELTETVSATISSPSIGSISPVNNTSTANILDDDFASLIISIGSPVDAIEGTSDISYSISIDGGLVNGTGAPITGTLSLTGTAISGVDYTAVSTFSIPDGASFSPITIPVMDDLIVEATETVIATISSPSIGSIGNASSTANILDDDSTSGFEEVDFITSNVIVYPNPLNSTLNIVTEQQMQHYSIFDLNGKIMADGKLNTMEVELNLGNLPEGFYLLTIVFSDGNSVSKRLLKQ